MQAYQNVNSAGAYAYNNSAAYTIEWCIPGILTKNIKLYTQSVYLQTVRPQQPSPTLSSSSSLSSSTFFLAMASRL